MMMRLSSTLLFAILLFTTPIAGLSVSACATDTGGDGDGDGDGDAPTVDEGDVLAAIADFRTSAAYSKMNATSVSSAHGAADLVDVYVAADAVTQYASIDPEDDTDTIDAFAPGTIIVKDHLDDSGVPNGSLTVMYKADAGYDADHGDWWWARVVSDAVADGGQVGYCISCHESSGFTDTDWVGGVALDNRQ